MKRFMASFFVITLVAGCAASPSGEPEQAEGVGTAEEALGEAACGTMSVTSDATLGAAVTSPSFHCAFWDTATSPDASYGSSSSACTSQFVVEVQNVSGHAFGFVSRPEPSVTLGADEATCNKLHATLGAYGHKAAGWSYLGYYSTHGAWTPPSGGFLGYCTMVLDADSPAGPTVSGTEGYDAVRAAGSAYTIETSKGEPYKSYVKVEAGIAGGQVC